jgi:hypothetical protein
LQFAWIALKKSLSLYKLKRENMKKAKRVEFGIEIVKPWSMEMYDHNDMVSEAVKVKVFEMWTSASSLHMSDMDWLDEATPEMLKIQKAVLCYSFGPGFDVAEVARRVEQEIEEAPYYRLKDIAEELELDLKVGFVGFS